MKINTIKRNYISSLEGLPYMLTLEMVAGLTGFNYETVKKFCEYFFFGLIINAVNFLITYSLLAIFILAK